MRRKQMSVWSASERRPMSELNTTPLIDVMLVLLVMFIITIPVRTHGIKIDLPVGAARADQAALHDEIAIAASGVVSWNGMPIDDAALARRMAAAVRQSPQPELHLRPIRMRVMTRSIAF